MLHGSFDKELHVSPFMGMDHRLPGPGHPPGPTLSVHIESLRGGHPVFDATLTISAGS